MINEKKWDRILSTKEIGKVLSMLEKDEGFRQYAYQDQYGNLTIGIGRNLSDRGISKEEAHILCLNDIEIVDFELNILFPWVKDLPENYRLVLINMGFQLGVPRLTLFKKMLAAMQKQNAELAAQELLDSLYAKQVPNRANRLAYLLIHANNLSID